MNLGYLSIYLGKPPWFCFLQCILLAFVCMCGHTFVSAYRVQKRTLNSLELELQVAVSHSVWMLGTKVRRAGRTLNCWAVSPACLWGLLKCLSVKSNFFFHVDNVHLLLYVILSPILIFCYNIFQDGIFNGFACFCWYIEIQLLCNRALGPTTLTNSLCLIIFLYIYFCIFTKAIVPPARQ